MLHEGTEEAGGETDRDGAAETDARDGGVEGFCVRVGDGASGVVVLWHFLWYVLALCLLEIEVGIEAEKVECRVRYSTLRRVVVMKPQCFFHFDVTR